MTPRRPRIAFLTSRDPANRQTQSGVFHFMAQSLQEHCGDVEFLGPLPCELPALQAKFLQGLDRFSQRHLGKRYNHDHCLCRARFFARQFHPRLENGRFDWIFAPNASTEIALLRTRLPIMYLSDTTMNLMRGYYPQFSNVVNFGEGQLIEWLALRRARAAVFRSAWAASSAIKDYGAPPARVFAVPNGANLDPLPDAERVRQRKRNRVCRLLFLGVNWERKGGTIAYETMQHLNAAGLPAELVVCGCRPPETVPREGLIEEPPVDKNDESQRRRLLELLMSVDFLLLPTRSDCFSNVVCEASACGLPSVTTDTGGVSAALFDGVNGRLLPREAGSDQYARVIREIFTNETLYHQFVRSSRKTFEERLNWRAWGEDIRKISATLLTGPRRGRHA